MEPLQKKTVTVPHYIDRNIVKTGDTSNIILYASISALLVAAAILLILWRRKDRRDKED